MARLLQTHLLHPYHRGKKSLFHGEWIVSSDHLSDLGASETLPEGRPNLVTEPHTSPVAGCQEGGTRHRACGVFWSILSQRCPRCRTGHIFRGAVTMNDPCPTCGLVFRREEGYFIGALYVSYTLSAAVLTALYFTAAALLRGWDTHVLVL